MIASFVLSIGLVVAAQGADEPPAYDADGLPIDAPADPPPAPAPPPSTTKDPSNDKAGDPKAADPKPGAPAPTGETPPDGDSDKIEFVGDEDGQDSFEAMPLPTNDDIADSEPPRIDDLAIAAQNPNGAPYVTAVITDDASGVATAIVYTRKGGSPDWAQTPLIADAGGLFLGRLPMGLQRTGFEYYVEVFDAKGNGPTRVGSPDEPLGVEAAGMGELAREKIPDATPQFTVHPAWVMVAMGAGILAAGVSGIFWYDVGSLAVQRGGVQETLDGGGLSNVERADLENEIADIDNAILGDVAIGGVLTVLAAAALGTGIGMLVVTELE